MVLGAPDCPQSSTEAKRLAEAVPEDVLPLLSLPVRQGDNTGRTWCIKEPLGPKVDGGSSAFCKRGEEKHQADEGRAGWEAGPCVYRWGSPPALGVGGAGV